MSKTVKNFLVGVGYDYDNKGEQSALGGLDSIKGKVLQLGAVVGGAFGLKTLTTGFADAKDELGKFSQAFDVVPSEVNALGQALEHQGGSLSSLMGQLESLSAMRDNLASGDAGFFGELGKVGIDANVIIDAENATQAYILLADQIEKLDNKARRAAIGKLGFDNASLALLSKGSDEVRAIIDEENSVRFVTDEMIQQAADFKDSNKRFANYIGGFADSISSSIIPGMINTTTSINGFLSEHADTINGVLSGGKSNAEQYEGMSEAEILESIQNKNAGITSNIKAFFGFESESKESPADVSSDRGAFVKKKPEQLDEMFTPVGFMNKLQEAQKAKPITVNSTLVLDGKVIDNRVIKVIGSEAQTVIDNVNTSVER